MMNRSTSSIFLVALLLLSTAHLRAHSQIVFLQEEKTTPRPEVQPGGPAIPGTLGVPGARRDVAPSEQQTDTAVEHLEDLTGDEPPPPQPPSPARPTAARATRDARGGMLLSFSNADIETVVQTVMQELGHSYVIDPQVSGTVNLYTMREIPTEKVLEVLEQLLAMNGAAMIRQQDLFVIVPIGRSTKIEHEIYARPSPAVPERALPESPEGEQEREEGSEQEPQEEEAEAQVEPAIAPVSRTETPVSGLEDARGVVTYIIPLHYIPSGSMIDMVRAFLSDGATVVDFTPANILILTDFRRNIEQVLRLVELLDTRFFDVNHIDLIPVRYNLAQEVAEDLAKIFSPSEERGGVRLVAIERLNSLLVITPGPSVLMEVKRWIDRLDVPATGTNIRTFVYQVENSTAMAIAEVLGQLYHDGMGLPSSVEGEVQEGQPPVAPVRDRQRDGAFVPGFDGIRGFQTGLRGGEVGPSLAGRRMAGDSGVRAVVTGNVKIVVNEFNNSLIIQATEADYEFLMQTIRELDTLPRQVLIEAQIYSVELRDELSFGIAAFLEQRGVADNDNGAPGHPTRGRFTPPTATEPGGLSLSSTAFIGSQRQLRAIINTLKSTTDVEILEAPRLLAMDGMLARINVGAEVPVTTASFGDPLRAGDSVNFINSISFRSTGTTLLIVPRITATGVVTMELAIEVSSPTGPPLTPTINRNFVETSMIVRDGQTAAIAGIISDSFLINRNRIPVLGDLPVLGPLFGQTSRDRRRNELLFLITPRVIRNLPTVTELTLDFRRALRNAYDYIRTQEELERELIDERRLRELEEQLQQEAPPR